MATALEVGAVEVYRLVTANTTNAQVALAAPGRVLGIYAFSTSASIRYVRLYDKASAPTVGTDPVKLTMQVSNIGSNGNPREIGIPADGLWFGTGIAVSCTGSVEDSDTTALGASGEVYLHVFYQRGAAK